jgi:hypothetical protein
METPSSVIRAIRTLINRCALKSKINVKVKEFKVLKIRPAPSDSRQQICCRKINQQSTAGCPASQKSKGVSLRGFSISRSIETRSGFFHGHLRFGCGERANAAEGGPVSYARQERLPFTSLTPKCKGRRPQSSGLS